MLGVGLVLLLTPLTPPPKEEKEKEKNIKNLIEREIKKITLAKVKTEDQRRTILYAYGLAMISVSQLLSYPLILHAYIYK